MPAGERDSVLQKVKRKLAIKDEDENILRDRFDVLQNMNPLNWIAGKNGMRRYFGAQFAKDLVVFENIRYGNALYIMEEDWQDISQLSRIEILDHNREKVHRIIHRRKWKQELRRIIRKLKRHHV